MSTQRRRIILTRCAGIVILSGTLTQPALAAMDTDFDSLSIEELTQVEVTSVSKRAERLSDAPAAIYVITSEDIRRSTATSLPEALRLAPNLLVQQIDARQYSIGARGFNGYETSNKLLGLIDGRTIYTPLHAGIFWDLREPMLDDLDRIEVISGSGGTLWGPNAVNGVINIISKSALDTQGGVVRGTASTRERTAAVRYGSTVGNGGAYRIYANGYDREGLPGGSAADVPDGGKGIRAGFRADFGGEADGFTFQGDYFYNDLFGIGRDTGHNVQARWSHHFASGSKLQLQAYYDKVDRRVTGLRDRLETFDVTAQHDIALGSHRIVWGAGVRTTNDLFLNELNPFVLDPPQKRLWIGNLFAQDSVSVSDDVTLIGGIKLERTSFTGLQILPNLRLAWKADERALFWAAISRSVRTPSRIDRQLTYPSLVEGGTFDSEKLKAIEAGYRGQPLRDTTLSISLFYNLYDGLRSTELDPVTIFPVRLDNGWKGHSYGVEAWASHQFLPWWRLSAGFATLHKHYHLKAGHIDIENGISLGNDPHFQGMLRSQMTVADSIEIDLMLRGVDDLPKPYTPGYVEADVRLGWKLGEAMELFALGTNLLHKQHDESGDTDRGQLAVRSVSLGARWHF